ncbi:protein kinase [Nonomuraea sp. NPDC046802]|uniref:serine/threonine protein kinase n=1 Tax=Nonomuraea sp. NPDC046802 TaxID=3154919 RepID=UPI0033C2BCD1
MVTPLIPDDPPSLGGYRLSGRLGEGGQGVVYLAHSPAGEPVAIKLLSTGDKETRARLGRELEALESIASFCTARVLDVSTGGQRPFVVSEYIDGPSLADRVSERGPLRGGELERLVVGTATALAAIHAAGIVHRDFKPANVLLGPDGPRVVDFGIARAEGAATLTSGLIGTPAYLAPEQISGSPASPASDVFAWAASMLYAATGTSPFGADTVPAVLHRVLHAEPDLSVLPERLRGWIGACVSKDPALRPTAQQLMVSLVTPNAPPPPTTGQAPSTPGPPPSGTTGPAHSAIPGPASSGPVPAPGSAPSAPPHSAPGPASSGPMSAPGSAPSAPPHSAPGPASPGPVPAPGSAPSAPPHSGPVGPASSAPSAGPGPGLRTGGGAGPGSYGAVPPPGQSSRDGGPTGPQGPAEITGGTRRSRSRGLLIGGVAATVALAVAATVTVLQLNQTPATGTGDRTSSSPATAPGDETPLSTETDGSTAPPATTTTPSDTPSTEDSTPTADPNLKIPAAFEGDWSGSTVSTNPLSSGAENSVKLKKGQSTAAWTEDHGQGTCSGTITLTKVEATRLTFSLGANEGNCVPGTIVLELKGDDALTYTWRDVPGLNIVTQTGTLKKG